MRHSRVHFYVFVIMAILSYACTKSANSEKSAPRSSTDAVMIGLIGTWLTDCVGIDDENNYTKIEVTFTPLDVATTASFYAGSDCTQITRREKSFERYVIGNPSTTALQSTNFDTALIRSTSMPLTEQEVKNDNDFFAQSDKDLCVHLQAAKGVETDTTVCEDRIETYSIIKVTGDQLQMGSSDGMLDGSAPEKRIAKLGDTVIATKLH